jgi:hypothetical protein
MEPFTNEKIVYLTVLEPVNSIYNYKLGIFIYVLIKNTPLKEKKMRNK